MERDLHNNVSGAIALAVQNITTNTTTAGAIIDSLGFESLEFFITSGTITDGAYALLLQESDDSGMAGATTVSAENTLGSVTGFVAADDNVVKRVGYIGKKRYVRLSIVSTGVTTGGTNFTATAVKGHPLHAPVA